MPKMDSGYSEALVRIHEAGRTGATELRLSFLGLTELPAELFNLTKLTELDLSENQLRPELAAAHQGGTKALLEYLRRQSG
ncbi:MAG: hypothetical protein ABIK43_01785 [candidate division WOR-3 bacterium]